MRGNRFDCNGKGTTDPYQDKVLRASQGSVFHIPVITADLKTFIAGFNGPVYGTALENAQPYKEVASQDIFALLLGNEGEGVNKALLNETSQNLTIPIYGKAESLNVAILWKYFTLSFERLTLRNKIGYT